MKIWIYRNECVGNNSHTKVGYFLAGDLDLIYVFKDILGFILLSMNLVKP